MENKTSSLSTISRRQFLFGAGVGMLTFLGSCATRNGTLFAFADENGETFFELVIVGRGDVAILCVDPTNNSVIPEMEVKITSYAEEAKEKVLKATSNDNGIAVVNARYLGENWDEENPYDGYGFWASVEATKAGYRDFATSVVRIQTGLGLATESGGRQANLTIPSQLYNSMTDFGYLRTLAFNGFDIQYFTSSFCACSGNVAEHTLSLDLIALAGKKVSASFVYDGTELASANGIVGNDGHASLEMKGEWLCDIEANKKAQVFFEIDGAKFEAPCNLCFFPGADGIEAYSQKESKMQIGDDSNPFLPDEKTLSTYRIKIPDSVPIWGGSNYDLPLPEWPVFFQFDPTGSVQLGVTVNLLPTIPKLREKEWVGNTNWDKMRTETWTQMRERQNASQKEAMSRYHDAKLISEGFGRREGMQTKFGGKVNLIFSVTVVAKADWKWDSDIWSGGLDGTLIIGGNYELGEVMVVGGVPIYYGFDLAAMLTTELYFGFQTESGFKNFCLKPDTNGLTITIRFELGFQAGIGIKGFLSVGLRGYGFIEGQMGLVKTEKACPHFLVRANMILTIVINALFSTFTVSVWHDCGDEGGKVWYDNWATNLGEDDSVTAQIPEAFKNSKATYVIPDAKTLKLTDFKPALISNESLLKLSEFSAVAKEFTDNDGKCDLSLVTSFKQNSKNFPKISGFGIVSQNTSLAFDDNASKLGIVPAVDKCIYENVLSDSRQRVLKTSDGSMYLFRLCVVDVTSIVAQGDKTYIKFNKETGLFEELKTPLSSNEQKTSFSVPRSRILMSKMTSAGTWGEPRLIDFYIKNDSQKRFRLNCNDYDFAVCEKPDEAGVFFFNVVSSQVIESDKDSFCERWKNQFITIFKFDSNKQGNDALVVGRVLKPVAGKARYCPSVNYRKISGHVFFSFVEAEIDGDCAKYTLNTNVYEQGAFTWAYPFVSNARVAFDGKKTSLYQTFKIAKGPKWEDESAAMTGIMWSCSAIDTQAYQVYFQAYSTTNKELLPGTVYTYKNSAEPVLVPEKGWISVDLDEGETEKPDRRELAFCTLNTRNWMIVSQKVGIANMTAFTPSDDGSRLFAVHTTDGEGGETKNYQIYAADWDSKRNSYHTFYPFCQTTHPLDQVETAVVGGGLATFVSTEITNAEAGSANIRQMNVPLVASLQLISATCMDVFAGVGDTCHASVCVYNNGNLPLKAFTVKLFDNEKGEGTPLATKEFSDLKNQVEDSVFDYQGEDEDGNSIHVPTEVWLSQKNKKNSSYGNFSAVDLNSLLWPGDQRSYSSIDFTVPQSWEDKGTAKIYAFVSEAVADDTRVSDIQSCASPDLDDTTISSTLSESSPTNFEVAGSVQPDSAGVFYDVDAQSKSFDVDLQSELAKDETVHKADYTPLNEEAENLSQSGELPETNDPTGALAGPLSILGAGAAVVATYSKRRCENESQ